MTSDRWDKVGALFEEAREVPPDERGVFLEEACEEEGVRKEVLSLLEAEADAGSLFEELAPDVSSALGPETPEDVADPLDLEGSHVGRYAVQEHLGSGGMGMVYRARDTKLGRDVALKFLPPHLAAHPEAEERFVREGALPVDEAVGYARQIAGALARAHEAGIVHRDVKPANVMVTETGEVKLLDFGLAKAATETQLTETGRQLGTAAYMSPEQAEGREVDGRTDVWALGVVLYEMLAGARPFRGERRTAVIQSILHDAPDPLQEHRPEIPAALEEIVGGCLRKEPGERYPSAEALADDLRAVASDADAGPVRHSFPSRTWMNASSRRWLVAGATVLLLTLGIGWIVWPTDTAQEASPSARRSEPSIAVLPFRSSGPDASTGTFAAGVQGDLLTRLSGISELQVIPRSSVQEYRGADEPVRRAARELGAEWVLEGDVQSTDEQVQVRARLINAEDVRQVWADRYRRALTAANLFDIQADITREIARALQVNLSPEEQARTGRHLTESTAAYELYLEARRTTYRDRRTKEERTMAMDLYRRAVALDSTFAEAWAGLADLYAVRSWVTNSQVWADSGLVAARRAIAHDPELADAYVQLGDNFGGLGRTDEQIAAYRSALARRPDHPQGLNNLCVVLGRRGRLATVMQVLDDAYHAAPESPSVIAKLAGYNAALGRDRTADAWLNMGRAQGSATEHAIHFLQTNSPCRFSRVR